MLRYPSLISVLALVLLITPSAHSSIVDGYAYLDGENCDCDIAVRCFTCRDIVPTKYTDCSGHFGPWLTILGGRTHCFEYSHLGYRTDTICVYIPLLQPITLPDVTLYKGLSGPLSGTLPPGDYRVYGDCWVESGQTLTMLNNTRILFTHYHKFDIYGTLLALGTADEPIEFTRNYVIVDDWAGLHFYEGSSSSFLQYCVIEGIDNDNFYAISCADSDPVFSHCTIRDNNESSTYAIFGFGSSEARLDTCLMVDNHSDVIYFGGNDTYITATNCTVMDNAGLAWDSYIQEIPDWHLHVINSIMWDNELGGGAVPSVFSSEYSVIEECPPGEGNICEDPGLDECWCPDSNSCVVDSAHPGYAEDLDGSRGDIGYCPYFRNDVLHCEYLPTCGQRLREDCYLYSSNWCQTSGTSEWEYTTGLADGEFGDGYAWFLMNMRGYVVVLPNRLNILIYDFGLIVAYDPETGDTIKSVRLNDDFNTYAGLAFDDRDNSFWVTFSDRADLYHYDAWGLKIADYGVEYDNITGLAYDAESSYLWCLKSGTPDLLLAYDISDQTPVLCFGPIVLDWTGSAGGLDYLESQHLLVAANRGARELSSLRFSPPATVNVLNDCQLHESVCPDPWGVALSPETKEAVIGSAAEMQPFSLARYRPATVVDTCDCLVGDCNDDGTQNITDCICIINWIFAGGPPPQPYATCSGDWNCDCEVNITDAVYCIQYIFASGSPPCTCLEWLDECGPPLRE